MFHRHDPTIVPVPVKPPWVNNTAKNDDKNRVKQREKYDAHIPLCPSVVHIEDILVLTYGA